MATIFLSTSYLILGPVAQRITRLTTNQEIAGSNPAWIENYFSFIYYYYLLLLFIIIIIINIIIIIIIIIFFFFSFHPQFIIQFIIIIICHHIDSQV